MFYYNDKMGWKEESDYKEVIPEAFSSDIFYAILEYYNINKRRSEYLKKIYRKTFNLGGSNN